MIWRETKKISSNLISFLDSSYIRPPSHKKYLIISGFILWKTVWEIVTDSHMLILEFRWKDVTLRHYFIENIIKWCKCKEYKLRLYLHKCDLMEKESGIMNKLKKTRR